MKNNRIIDLRRDLEQLDTERLDSMLQDAVHKEPADGETVRLILDILEKREEDDPVVINPATERAWKMYLQDTADVKPRRVINRSWTLRVASIVLIVGLLLLAVPQEAEADSFFQRMARWTDSIFEMFGPNDVPPEEPEYRFVTDHPGLQEVYDAVTELGITVPVVPMWIPEEYELVECKVMCTPSRNTLMAKFTMGTQSIVIKVDQLSDNISNAYQKDQSDIDVIEIAEVKHNLMNNEGAMVVVWSRDSIECFIHAECQEDDLRKILTSIYTMEDE